MDMRQRRENRQNFYLETQVEILGGEVASNSRQIVRVKSRVPAFPCIAHYFLELPGLESAAQETGKFGSVRYTRGSGQRHLPPRSFLLHTLVHSPRAVIRTPHVRSPSFRLSNRNRGRQPLVTSRILRLVGKFSGFLSAYPNWLPPTQTIQTQTTSSSRVWTHRHARGVGWFAGTSSGARRFIYRSHQKADWPRIFFLRAVLG